MSKFKIFNLSLLLICGGTSFSIAQTTDGGDTAEDAPVVLEKLVHKDAGFQVEMYSSPKQTSSSEKGKGKDAGFIIKQHVVAGVQGKSIYMVRVTDVPRFDASSEHDANLVIGTNMEIMTKLHKKNLGIATKVHEKKTPGNQERTITQGSMKGRAVRLSNPDTREGVRLRTFFENGRLYQVIAGGSLDTLDSKQTDHFLDSFKLLK